MVFPVPDEEGCPGYQTPEKHAVKDIRIIRIGRVGSGTAWLGSLSAVVGLQAMVGLLVTKAPGWVGEA